jgi:hypothetical protein
MIDEIKKEMTDAFVSDEEIKKKYDLKDKTFEEQFAKVSVESKFFYIVATAIAQLRFLFEMFRIEVENRIKAAIPGTVAWYHNLVMNFEYNGEQIINYCAVTEEFPWLRIKVNTANHGVIGKESDEMIALRSYLSKNKFAGTQINLTSELPETIEITMTVWLSASKYSGGGGNLVTGDKSVEQAIDDYLAGILYSGTFYKSKVVDAVQLVDGVSDVELVSAKIGGISLAASYQSKTGAFVANKIITYVLG